MATTLITETEELAQKYKNQGFKNVVSRKRISASDEDVNLDGIINGQDAVMVYEAMMKQ